VLRLFVPFGALIAIAVAQAVPASVWARASGATGPVEHQPGEDAADTIEAIATYMEQLDQRRFDEALATAGQ
jgi:hypothetical protein